MITEVEVGATNVSIYVRFVDDDGGTAPGEPTTGLLFSDIETGGSASYVRQGATRTDMSLISQSAGGGHTDGGFVLVDDTNMPGLYRLDPPDTPFASGADFVIFQCVAAPANNSIMVPVVVKLRDSPSADVTKIGGVALFLQATKITAYELSGSNGKFTVELMTEAPGNNDEGRII